MSDPQIELAGDPNADPCTPENRRKKGRPPGVPVVLSDGQTWQLPYPGLHPVLNDVRDRMFNEVTWSRRASAEDVSLVAWMLLLEDYRLTQDEAALLVVVTKDKAQQLLDGVIDAMFGPSLSDGSVEYTDWATSAFVSNGLNPELIPPHLHQPVLGHLVASGRAVAADRMVGSAIANRKRKALDLPGGR